MQYIKFFNQISKEDVAFAGGKGASLGEMTQAGIPVPPGFVLLASAFDAFMAEANIAVEIAAVLDTVNTAEMHTVEHASEKIQALILQAVMPQDIASEIMEAYEFLSRSVIPTESSSGGISPFRKASSRDDNRQASDNLLVAVRSSATAEDSASAAWAGQLDSFLNTTKETLLQNVQKCWASLFTPRAIFYRFEKKLHTQQVSVAVVVQAMVQSEVSGIVFSVHPVTQDRNQLIIEAGFGLGEAIVSGQVTPDSYVVTKHPLAIVDKNIFFQDHMLVRSVDGGNVWVSTLDAVIPDKPRPGEARSGIQSFDEPGSRLGGRDDKTTSRQKLSDAQILELSELILKIENHYGFPCDIEWAWANEQFYITQSRPITTLQINGVNPAPKYEKFFSRDFCLASVQAWVRGESTNPKGWTEQVQPHLPYIVTERADDTVHFWYDTRGVEWVQDLLVDLAKSDQTFLKKIEQGVQKSLTYIRPIYEAEKVLSLIELKRFVQELESGYPWFEAMWWYCQMDSSKLAGLDITDMQKVRELTDVLCNASDTVIRKSLLHACPALGDLAGAVSIEEIMTGNIPEKEILAKRDSGYFYGNEELLVGMRREEIAHRFKIDFHIENVEKDVQKISGVAAMKGVVRGFVRRVMGHKQIGDVQEGEILVTPMTIPDFMPAMQKAAAFITDEGGITSHAAITARELRKPAIVGTGIATQVLQDGDLVEVNGNHAAIVAKKLQKPCVVGTKIATHVLHDGDLVEVDATNGVVRVIEKANR